MPSRVVLALGRIDVHCVHRTLGTPFPSAAAGPVLCFALSQFGGNFRVTRSLALCANVSTGHCSPPPIRTFGIDVAISRARFSIRARSALSFALGTQALLMRCIALSFLPLLARSQCRADFARPLAFSA